jgi:hypothetical protein
VAFNVKVCLVLHYLDHYGSRVLPLAHAGFRLGEGAGEEPRMMAGFRV